MRSTGVRRKLDDLGRVVIPAGIRRSLDLQNGDAIEFSVDGDDIILSRATDRCVVCGDQREDLRQVRERKLCPDCVAEVAALREDAGEATSRSGTDDTAPADRDPTPAPSPAGDQPRAAEPPRRLERESADLAELREEAYEPGTTDW